MIKSSKPLQLYLLACLSIAWQHNESIFDPTGSNSSEDRTCLLKYASYQFSPNDLAKTEVKVLAAIGFALPGSTDSDDLIWRVNYYTRVVASLLSESNETAPSSDVPIEVRWIQQRCMDIVELVYFNSVILSSHDIELLACAIVQAALACLIGD